ncbi:MAG: hypothetical protein ACE5JU_02985 [Candidatus Binatia bacterium]
MDLQKINVKFFVEDSNRVPLTAFINIFHSWIQASDGDYYDLVDYSHMYAGPGILLIAHEANISIDNAGNRVGLLYNRKQPLQGTNREKLRLIFRSALESCRRIEEEPSLHGKFKFRGNESLFLINDRLFASNTEGTFHAIKPDLEDLATSLYAGANFSLHQKKDDFRERFAAEIKSSVDFDISTLLKNLH